MEWALNRPAMMGGLSRKPLATRNAPYAPVQTPFSRTVTGFHEPATTSLLSHAVRLLFGARGPSGAAARRVDMVKSLDPKQDVRSLYQFLTDASVYVQRAAVNQLQDSDWIKTGAREHRLAESVEKRAQEWIADAGRFPRNAIMRAFEQAGYQVLYANDILPADALSEDALYEHNLSDDDVEGILNGDIAIAVRELFTKPQAAEIVFKRGGKGGYVLFSETKRNLKPETYWHEFFHLLQFEAGLFGKKDWPADVLFKREMETNAFILDHQDDLGVDRRGVLREIGLWRNNFAQYLEATKRQNPLGPLLDEVS